MADRGRGASLVAKLCKCGLDLISTDINTHTHTFTCRSTLLFGKRDTMLRTLVGLAMLWTVQSQACSITAQCSPMQTCISGKCRCPIDGWKGAECDCLSESTCNGNGRCTDESNSVCACGPGWVGLDCAIFCEDADHCSGHGTCKQDGSCACSSGDWTGPNCDCSPSDTCNGNGVCDPSTSKCMCDPGLWTGVHCNIPCAPGAGGSTTCDSQGICFTDQDCPQNQHCDDTFNCVCNRGWIGASCNKPCTGGCQNGGYCDPKIDIGIPCICEGNWHGPWCGAFCDDAQCGQGKCVSTSTARKFPAAACVCDGDWVDWKGATCDCSPSVTCSGNGKCEGVLSKCKCDNGWFGAACEFACDPATTCSGHGDCLGDGSCKCSGHWTGANCDQCSANWMGNDCAVFCDPSTTCSGHGDCQADGSCKCSNNWMGANCGHFCDSSTTCNARGTCDAAKLRCNCVQGFDPATNCQKCLPNYSGHDCDVYCSDDVTCHGNGQCDASGKCLCEDKYNSTADCGNQASIFGDPHFSNVDNEKYDFHGADPSGYYAYTDDEVSVTTWHYFCDETLHKGMTCVERVAILQKSNGDMLEFKRTDTGMETSVKLTSCQGSFMNLASWSPSIVLPSSMRYEAPQHERGATVSLLDSAGRAKMLLTVWYLDFQPLRDPLLSFSLQVYAVLYQKRPASLDGGLGAFFLEAKYGNVLKKSTVTNTCLTGRSAAVLNTDEATTTIPTVAEELAKCTSDAAREHALECCAPGKACGTWYAQCLFEACLHYVPGEGCTDHMIDVLMFKEQGSEKSCFCPSETMTPDHVSQTCSLCKPHHYPLPGPGVAPADACATRCTSEDCPEESPYCNSRGECSTAEHMRQREGKHTPALAESAWAYHLPSDKHPCAPGKALGRLVELREVLTPENVGPLTFGDEAIMIEARVRMRSATKWARIIDFGNGAKGSVVFGQRRLSKKLGFETHSFDTCNTAQGRRVNSPVALPEDEDVWTWVAFTLTKEGVATMYHNNEPVAQVSGVALPEFGTRVKNYVRTPKKRSGDGWNGDIEHLTFSTCFVRSSALPSEWSFNLPKAKHPCVSGEVLGRIVQVEEAQPGGSDIGPLTFGDEAIMIEALVQMRSATKWASIIDFGNGAAKGNVVFGQRSASKKLSFESHPFETCSRQQGTRDVNSRVALPEDEDVWTWVAFTLTKDGVATIYHNNEQVTQVTGVALPEFGTRVKNYVRGSHSPGGDGGWDGAIRHLSVSTCSVPDAPVAPIPPVVIPQ